MAAVKFVLSEPPYEPGDVVELSDADAENKFYDGIVEYVEGAPAVEQETEVSEEVEGAE